MEDIQKGEPLIFALMVENQLMRPRNWHLKEKLSALDQKFKIINETVKLNVQAWREARIHNAQSGWSKL